jgi:hypothetical protein
MHVTGKRAGGRACPREDACDREKGRGKGMPM